MNGANGEEWVGSVASTNENTGLCELELSECCDSLSGMLVAVKAHEIW